MVNNSTNINKANSNHSPQIIEHKYKIQVLAWDKHKQMW